MLCLRLAILILIVLFLGLASSYDGMESLHDQYREEQNNLRRDICTMKPEFGKCKGRRSLWYFNERYGKCLSFTYSNCGGNRNRFYTKESCQDFCDKLDWSTEKLRFKSLNKKRIIPFPSTRSFSKVDA